MRPISALRLVCMVSVMFVFFGGASFGRFGWHWISVTSTLLGVGWLAILFSFLLSLLQEALIELERITSGKDDE